MRTSRKSRLEAAQDAIDADMDGYEHKPRVYALLEAYRNMHITREELGQGVIEDRAPASKKERA